MPSATASSSCRHRGPAARCCSRSLAVSPQVCTVGGEAHWLVEQFPDLRPGAPGVDSNRLGGERVIAEIAGQIGRSLWERMVDAERRRRDPVDLVSGSALGRENAEELVADPVPESSFPGCLVRVPLARSAGERQQHHGRLACRRLGHVPVAGGLGRAVVDDPAAGLAAAAWPAARGNRCLSVADEPTRSSSTICRASARALGHRLVCRIGGGPGRVLRGVCDFAGLEFDAALAQRVAAPLPPSRHTLTPPAEGKWRRNVAEVLRVLPRSPSDVATPAAVADGQSPKR